MDELQQLFTPDSREQEDLAEHVNALGLLLAPLACVLAWVAVIALAVWALQAAQGWLW